MPRPFATHSPGVASGPSAELALGALVYHRAMSRRIPPEEGPAPELERERPCADPPESGSSPDDALILWMLSLTPTERLAVAQGFIDSTFALRNGQRS